MKRISKLINMPILSEKNGAWLGRVSDVLFDAKTMNVAGYFVITGSVIQLLRYLERESVKRFDKGCIWVEDKNSLRPASDVKKSRKYKSFQRDTDGAQIIENGDKIGTISDMLYNTEFGEITHFEVSNGFAEDILHGRKNIIANKEIVFGNNNIEINDKGV